MKNREHTHAQYTTAVALIDKHIVREYSARIAAM
jgi:hypothetical protein